MTSLTITNYNHAIKKTSNFEILKSKIKGTTIAYSINKNRRTREKENNIKNEIEKLTTMAIRNPENKNIIESVEKQKQKLDIHNLHKARGAQIRSRVKYIQDGEKNTNFFWVWKQPENKTIPYFV